MHTHDIIKSKCIQEIKKKKFKTNSNNFYYEVMSFDLKNAEATHQRLMDYIFMDMLGRSVEFYVDTLSSNLTQLNNISKTYEKSSKPFTTMA